MRNSGFLLAPKDTILLMGGALIMVIYGKPGIVEVSYDIVQQVIIFDWTSFLISLPDIQELHQKALETAQLKDCQYYIAETSKVITALPQEVIQWWGGTQVPKLASIGLKAIVTVVPDNAIASMSTTSWQSEVIGTVIMKNVKTLPEAFAVVHDLRLNAAFNHKASQEANSTTPEHEQGQ